MITFKHSGNAGDIIYSLYTIKEACKDDKALLYIHLNQPADYGGRVHPLGNIMMNKQMYELIRPFLLLFDFVADVQIYNHEEVDYDLDLFRSANYDFGRGSIVDWYQIVYPELRPKQHEALLPVDLPTDIIVANRTFRYRNPDIRYKCLNDIDLPIYFLGLPDEYEDFKLRVPKAIHRPIATFAEAFDLISRARFFVGNQSSMFAIAEICNADRILEVYKHCPNVIPKGGVYYNVINENMLRSAVYKFML